MKKDTEPIQEIKHIYNPPLETIPNDVLDEFLKTHSWDDIVNLAGELGKWDEFAKQFKEQNSHKTDNKLT